VHRSDAPNLRLEMQDAAPAARMEIAAHNVANLDRRLNQVDLAIEEAAQRARPTPRCPRWKGSAGLVRVSPVSETRWRAPLGALKAERASLSAQSRRIEMEAAPIR
jgi:hypothetical protein